MTPENTLETDDTIISTDDAARATPGEIQAREIAIAKFNAAVSALEEVVDYETGMLENHKNPDFATINSKKTRGLRDLNNTMSEIARYMNSQVEHYVETLLERLKIKLERNSELLKMHLEAVSELSQMMQATARANETDGTYDPYSMKAGGHF